MPQPRAPRRARVPSPASGGLRAAQTEPPGGANAATATTALAGALGALNSVGAIATATRTASAAAALTRAEGRAILRTLTLNFRRLSQARAATMAYHVEALFVGLRPRRDEVAELVKHERRREESFRLKQLARLRRDVGLALRVADQDERLRRLRVIADREARYQRQREQAVAERAKGTADARNVREASPEGALWQLGARENHCPGCLYLANLALPWSVLRDGMVPPLGPGCGCRLRGVRQAWLMGDVPTLPVVLDEDAARRHVAVARALGHAHRHDGGVSLGDLHG